jgi:hypothetical protein
MTVHARPSTMNRRGEADRARPGGAAQGGAAPQAHRPLDLAALEQIKDEQVLAQQIRAAVVEFLRIEQAPLSAAERESVIEEIVYEVTGLGPLEPLFRDPTISDILVNGPKDCYIERRGKLSRVKRELPRQRPPADGHRPHLQQGRAPGGRVVADGGRPPARRVARQRHHPAARHRRARCCRSGASARRSPRSSWSRRAR